MKNVSQWYYWPKDARLAKTRANVAAVRNSWNKKRCELVNVAHCRLWPTRVRWGYKIQF